MKHVVENVALVERMRKNMDAMLNNPKAVKHEQMVQIMVDLGRLYTVRLGQEVLIMPVINHEKNRERIKEFIAVSKKSDSTDISISTTEETQ